MPQNYVAKDGTVHEFPDDATPEEIQWAADQIDGFDLGKPVRSDRELFAFNSPYAREGNVSGLEMLFGAAKGMFGNDEAAAKDLAEKGGGSVQDVGGTPAVVSKSGERYYANDPGFGLSDAENMAGNVAAFAPGAALVTRVPSLTGRVLAGAGTTAATDAGLQAATTGDVDLTRTGLAAGFGGVGEIMGPLIGGVYRHARTGSMSRQELITRGRMEILKLKNAGQLDDSVALALGKELDQIQAGGDPRAMLSEAEFGLRYTRGQKTGDMRQLTREEMLRNDAGSRASGVMRANDQYNYDRVIGAVDDAQAGLTGRRTRVTPADAMDTVSSTVRREATALDDGIDKAYNNFRGTKAYVGNEPQMTLPGRIDRALLDFDVAPPTTPAASRAVEVVRETFGDSTQAMSATRIDQFRRRLRTLQGVAGNATDRAAVGKVVREFDTWLDDTAMAGLVGGDQGAISTLKEARKLRSEYGSRFGDNGEFSKRFDRVVRQMVEDGADPEEMARAVYGSSQVSAAWTNRAFLRMDAALGKNPAAKAELRAAVLTKLVQGKTGETVGLQQLQSNLRTLLTENPALARNVLGGEGVAKVQRLVSAIDPLLKTADKRSSGTAERMWRYMTQSVTGLPVLGRMLEVMKSAGDLPAAQRALAPIPARRPAGVPALGAAIGANEGR